MVPDLDGGCAVISSCGLWPTLSSWKVGLGLTFARKPYKPTRCDRAFFPMESQMKLKVTLPHRRHKKAPFALTLVAAAVLGGWSAGASASADDPNAKFWYVVQENESLVLDGNSATPITLISEDTVGRDVVGIDVNERGTLSLNFASS